MNNSRSRTDRITANHLFVCFACTIMVCTRRDAAPPTSRLKQKIDQSFHYGFNLHTQHSNPSIRRIPIRFDCEVLVVARRLASKFFFGPFCSADSSLGNVALGSAKQGYSIFRSSGSTPIDRITRWPIGLSMMVVIPPSASLGGLVPTNRLT
mmetsp:Transcript_97261/g.197575  ORF Transcript_97261/g.197575 Transcript_97261/m.197575 type:complete len:152 (-) Transcript_97261:776-1231(-)